MSRAHQFVFPIYPISTKLMRSRIPENMQFSDYSDLLAKGRIADAILICVLVSLLLTHECDREVMF